MMAVYEVMKVWTLQNVRNEKDMSFFENARNGAVAGAIASLVTNPIDVIKTRMMVSRDHNSNSLYRTALEILSDDGIAGFFKASLVRMVSVSFACVMFFVMYEPAKALTYSQLTKNTEAEAH